MRDTSILDSGNNNARQGQRTEWTNRNTRASCSREQLITRLVQRPPGLISYYPARRLLKIQNQKAWVRSLFNKEAGNFAG